MSNLSNMFLLLIVVVVFSVIDFGIKLMSIDINWLVEN